MSRAGRIALAFLVIYLVYLVAAWVWFYPGFVDKRVRQKISMGMPASEVVKVFKINPSFDIPSAAHCGVSGPASISRIATYTSGGVVFLPLPLTLPTTTTFCFDGSDKLVAISTNRWLDGP